KPVKTTKPRRRGRVSKRGSSKRQTRSRRKARAVKPAAGPPGFLVVVSRPHARVWVDGRNTHRDTPIRPDSPLKLSPGKHRIMLVVGRRRFKFTKTIRSGQTRRMVELLKMP
ncbi:MAG: hypothetical protein KAI47_27480, partial [Deltaproteobacteria bacterium]|nr:hypothetical protein [Deltaproteobacteria bacterium]